MKVKTAKTIRTVLFVIACIVFIYGLNATGIAKLQESFRKEQEATDVTKVSAKVTDMKSWFNPSEQGYYNGAYHIEFTIELKNNAGVNWCGLKVITHVYDKNHVSLGTVTSNLGSSSYDSSNLRLVVGGEAAENTEIISASLNNFTNTLYYSSFSDLIFESEVTYGTYYK